MNISEANKEFALGIGAIFATVFMSSGQWDIFDLLISSGFILYVLLIFSHSRQNFIREILLAGMFGLVTLSFTLSVTSVGGLYFEKYTWVKLDPASLSDFESLFPYDKEIDCIAIRLNLDNLNTNTDDSKSVDEMKCDNNARYPDGYSKISKIEKYKYFINTNIAIFALSMIFWMIVLRYKSKLKKVGLPT